MPLNFKISKSEVAQFFVCTAFAEVILNIEELPTKDIVLLELMLQNYSFSC